LINGETMSNDVQNLSGKQFGQYELREVLGEGGMGAVYRAFQRNLNREVAVKVMIPQVARDPEYLARFTREAHTAAGLEHPHIITIHDYGTQTLENGVEVPFVVMRLLTGGTLSERVNRRNLVGQVLPSLAETATLLKQIAGAMDYAHSRGVIHRDIKPSNIMFDAQGSPYLVDFGIVKLADSVTMTEAGTAMGTPAYMSPEQWRGDKLTAAADQYALGVVVYQMTTGRMPFEGETTYNLMYQHLNELPTPPHGFRPDLPEPVSRVLEKVLAKQPEDRYPNVAAFAAAFAEAVREKVEPSTGFFTASLPLTPGKTPISSATMPDGPTITPLPQRGTPVKPSLSTGAALLTSTQTLEAIPASSKSMLQHPVIWIGAIIIVAILVVLSLPGPRNAVLEVAGLAADTATATATSTATTTETALPTATATSAPTTTTTPTIEPTPTDASPTEDTDALFSTAMASMSEGNYPSVVEQMDTFLTLESDNIDALILQGDANYNQGLSLQAINAYGQVIALAPDNAEGLYRRGITYYWGGDLPNHLQRAIDDFTGAIEADPNYALPYMGRGMAYVDQRAYERAIADFDRLLELEPNSAEGYFRRGEAYAALGNDEAALADFDLAIFYEPNLPDLYARRGDINDTLGNLQEAMGDYLSYASLLEVQGGEMEPFRRERLAELINYLTPTRPTSTPTPRATATPRPTRTPRPAATATTASTATPRPTRTLRPTSTPTVQFNPEEAQAAFDQGTELLNQGDCVAAIDLFTQALDFDPTLAFAWISRAYCYADQGDFAVGASDALQFIALLQVEVVEGDPLQPGQEVSLQLTQGRVYRIPVPLIEGQTLTIRADSPDGNLDPLLVLLAPDGTPLIHNDDGDLDSGDLNARIINFPVPESGTYTLIVTHAGSGSEGEVVVLVEAE